jgi:hypothetical protein
MNSNGIEESATKEIPCESEEVLKYKEITNKAVSDYSETQIKFDQLLPAIIKHNGNVQEALCEVVTKINWLKYYDLLRLVRIRAEKLIRPIVPDYLILYVILKGVEKRDVDAELKKLPVYNEEEAFYVSKMPELIKKYPNVVRSSWAERAEALIKNKGNMYYSVVDLYDGDDWVSVYKNNVISLFENYGVKLPEVKEEEIYPKIKAARGNFDIVMREYMSIHDMMTYHKTKIAYYREEYSIKESVTDESILELIEKNNGDHPQALRDVPKNNDIPDTIPLNQPVNEEHEWSELIANLPNSYKNPFGYFYGRVLEELRDQYKIENASEEEILDVYVASFIDKVPLKDALESLAKGEKKDNSRSENARAIVWEIKKKCPPMVNFCNKRDFHVAAQMCPNDEDMIISLSYTLFK